MEQLFTITQQNRKILNQYLDKLSPTKLFTVPEGFNNNIWWNIAHVVVTQQKLVYGLSSLPLNLSKELVMKYEKGTFPKERPGIGEINEIKKLLFALPERTQSDYKNNIFKEYTAYMTSAKVELCSVEDAIAFNVFHEGLHLGSIMALARAVKV